jgi:hypothetical protein
MVGISSKGMAKFRQNFTFLMSALTKITRKNGKDVVYLKT